jgi:dsRNA-specific ribonuclease
VSVPTLGEATAEGTSKQEAETAAAAALLAELTGQSKHRLA